mmetsp:Transcript_28722/g.40059  ORF Transcript_28722/g.40059 Transcript_28722/m.40059 type:complete len:267 (-) Transcript_28722:101-901(-)
MKWHISMRASHGLVHLSLAIVALLWGTAAKRIVSGKVHVLDASNFEHDTQATTGMTTGDWFIKFYAPWCGHCKALTPKWETLAKKLKKKVTVASVDVTQNRILGQRFGITGFPTLIFLHHGKMYKYEGMRKVKDLKKFALGGYRNAKEEDIPPEPSMLVSALFEVLEQFASWSQKRPLMGLGVLTLIGFALAVVLVVLFEFCLMPLCQRQAKEQITSLLHKEMNRLQEEKKKRKDDGAATNSEAGDEDEQPATATGATTGETKKDR